MPSVFPWLNLPAPSTHGVTNDELPTHIQLGAHRLSLQPSGTWNLDNENIQLYTNKINQLNSQINELQLNGHSSSINKSAYELEKHSLELEKYNIELLNENERLKFQNKLLLAMCAISEGDYKKLCQEANWNNVDANKISTAQQHVRTNSAALNTSDIDTTVTAPTQSHPVNKIDNSAQQRMPYNENTVISG